MPFRATAPSVSSLGQYTLEVDLPNCGICGQIFTRKSDIKRHIRTHVPNSKDYSCQHCPRNFSQAAGLKQHALTHTHERVACPECKKTFSCASGVTKHRKAAHGHVPKHTDAYYMKKCMVPPSDAAEVRVIKRSQRRSKPYPTRVTARSTESETPVDWQDPSEIATGPSSSSSANSMMYSFRLDSAATSIGAVTDAFTSTPATERDASPRPSVVSDVSHASSTATHYSFGSFSPKSVATSMYSEEQNAPPGFEWNATSHMAEVAQWSSPSAAQEPAQGTWHANANIEITAEDLAALEAILQAQEPAQSQHDERYGMQTSNDYVGHGFCDPYPTQADVVGLVQRQAEQYSVPDVQEQANFGDMQANAGYFWTEQQPHVQQYRQHQQYQAALGGQSYYTNDVYPSQTAVPSTYEAPAESLSFEDSFEDVFDLEPFPALSQGASAAARPVDNSEYESEYFSRLLFGTTTTTTTTI